MFAWEICEKSGSLSKRLFQVNMKRFYKLSFLTLIFTHPVFDIWFVSVFQKDFLCFWQKILHGRLEKKFMMADGLCEFYDGWWLLTFDVIYNWLRFQITTVLTFSFKNDYVNSINRRIHLKITEYSVLLANNCCII